MIRSFDDFSILIFMLNNHVLGLVFAAKLNMCKNRANYHFFVAIRNDIFKEYRGRIEHTRKIEW